MLDASAFLAGLQREPGYERVRERLAVGAAISTVNLAEVGSKLAEHGADPARAFAVLARRGLLGTVVVVEPFLQADAVAVADLRPPTRRLGLSLADRACIALGQRLGVPVVTTDRRWVDAAVPVEVEVIR